MAAGTFESTEKLAPAAATRARTRARTDNPFVLAVEALSSLKLTVILFAYGIFVVLVGTLAQTEMDIWQVVPIYFRSWLMPVNVNLFFPPAFFPEMPRITFDLLLPSFVFKAAPLLIGKEPTFPAPGGMLVGVLMLANLTAAHLWRFQMQARGQRLWSGLGVLAAGIAITTTIIVSGNLGTGVQAKPFLSPGQIWAVFLGILFAGWLGATYFFGRYALQEWTAMFRDSALFWFRLRLLSLFGSGYVALTVLVGAMFSGILEPPTESMRILWQLLQGTAAGAVLLAGCWLLFQKRAGIVLLHAGVVLMMVNELVVARYAIEWQMTLEEGEAANFARDIRTTELAIIDRSQPDADQVTVVPRDLLVKNAEINNLTTAVDWTPVPIKDKPGKDALLPFDVAVLKHYRNHNVRRAQPGEKVLATAGAGTQFVAEAARSSKGTDSNSEVDIGAIYAKLTEKKTGRDLGTYLISQLGEEGIGVNPDKFRETVAVGGKKYELVFRFARDYKPYTVKLIDVRKDDYLGSDTPKNYSSDVRLVDPETNIDNKIHIKMNDPLRYRGDTFYQSNYARQPNGSEVTTLAVVSNVGWMIPYLACMIVATGMIFQFGLALDRFLNRRSQEEALARAPITKPGTMPAGMNEAVR
ncbi:MAG: cytochrome c biogenesis protein ResB, partial [Pirellulaceae bacterium]